MEASSLAPLLLNHNTINPKKPKIMNALNQILSQIRRILGLSTSIRSTTQSVKRESEYI